MSDPSRLRGTDAATLVRQGLVALTAIGIFASRVRAGHRAALERGRAADPVDRAGRARRGPRAALRPGRPGGTCGAGARGTGPRGLGLRGARPRAGQLRVRCARPALCGELGHAACAAEVVVGRDEDGGPAPTLALAFWVSRRFCCFSPPSGERSAVRRCSRLRAEGTRPRSVLNNSALLRGGRSCSALPNRYGGVRGRRCRARCRGVGRCVRGRRGCGSRRSGAGRCWRGSRGRSRSAGSTARRRRRR